MAVNDTPITYTTVKFRVRLNELTELTAPKLYCKYVVVGKIKTVLYISLKKKLYIFLRRGILFYNHLLEYLKNKYFQ